MVNPGGNDVKSHVALVLTMECEVVTILTENWTTLLIQKALRESFVCGLRLNVKTAQQSVGYLPFFSFQQPSNIHNEISSLSYIMYK